MKKNGFTLVELMVVIVIIAVVATIGLFGVTGITDKINLNLWNKKVELIERNAISYGEDNLMLLQDGETNCLYVTIEELIKSGYISTKETDENGKKILTNNTKEKSDANYNANNMRVCIYKENNMVYAKLEQ